MIFGLHRQALVLGIDRRALRHRPGQQHAVPFETEVVVQVRGEVLLHAEEQLVLLFLLLQRGVAAWFRRLAEVAFLAVILECHVRRIQYRAMAPSTANDRAFFGHPRALSTLFFTEMWERFSYYGMRALLLLYMTAPLTAGGLGFDAAQGGAIYGLYTSMVYMATLPGGWIADRLIGPRRAVLYGGMLIAAGHFSMAASALSMFYLGLFLIVIGTGLLKGNVSVIVGKLYAEGDSPPRCRLLDLLHGHQPRRVHRAADLRLPRPADQLAHGVCRRRRRHDARRDPIRARQPQPRRCGLAARAGHAGAAGQVAPAGADQRRHPGRAGADRRRRRLHRAGSEYPRRRSRMPPACSCWSSSSDSSAGCIPRANGRPRSASGST